MASKHIPGTCWAMQSLPGTKHPLDGNEDRAFVKEEGSIICMGVFDGVSGNRGGDLAAEAAAQAFGAFVEKNTHIQPRGILSGAFRAAHSAVRTVQAATPGKEKMSCTVAALLVDSASGEFHTISAGDSAVFLYRGGKLYKLTVDSTRNGLDIAQGRCSARKAEALTRTNPSRKALLEYLGKDPAPAADLRGPFQLEPGDTFIACTDGLHSHATPSDIRRILRKDLPIDEAIGQLYRTAVKTRGGTDDVTIILYRYGKSRRPVRASKALPVLSHLAALAAGVALGIALGGRPHTQTVKTVIQPGFCPADTTATITNTKDTLNIICHEDQ